MSHSGGIQALRARQILLAALAALGLHAAAVAGVFWQPRTTGAQGAGSGGLEVGLAGALGATAAEAMTETLSTDADPEPVEESPVEEVSAEATAIEEVNTQDAPTPEAQITPAEEAVEITPLGLQESPAQPAEIMQATPADEPSVEQALIEETPVETVEQPAVEATKPPPPEVVAFEAPRPVARPAAPTRRPAPATAKPTPPTRTEKQPNAPQKAAAPARDTAPSDGAERTTQAGASGNGAAGGGDPGAESDYKALVQARLARAKVYPRRALARRLEGVGRLRFSLNSAGHVNGGEILRSSGHDLIDRAILDMLRRAQPFPPIPASVGRSSITFELNIRFQIP